MDTIANSFAAHAKMHDTSTDVRLVRACRIIIMNYSKQITKEQDGGRKYKFEDESTLILSARPDVYKV